MKPTLHHSLCITLLACLCNTALAADSVPSRAQLWELVQQQQARITALEQRLEQQQQALQTTRSTLEENTRELEQAADAFASAAGAGAGSRVDIGGYGELHYNNLDDENADIGGDDALDKVDFHRFVLFFGHEFSPRVRFFSELELEHALSGEGKEGEVELEQAWVELDLGQQHRFRAGLDILPIGILNDTHEPNTFYGVERNRIEQEIIPTTWWEAGAGFNGELAPGWDYVLLAHGGLKTPIAGSSTLRPRSGRKKVSEVEDQALATTGRIRYRGTPGLELAVSGQYQADITGTTDAHEIAASLLSTHIDYRHPSGLGLRALYARWDYHDVPETVFGSDERAGWYVEPAWRRRITLTPADWGEFGLFFRYSQWDQNWSGSQPALQVHERRIWRTGLNWWPHPGVVFKFDYQNEDSDKGADSLHRGFNLGMGYAF